MAQNDTITAATDVWTELTDANATNITFLVTGPPGATVYVKATAGAPSLTDGDVDGAIPYKTGQGERNVAIASLFPGISGANRLSVHPVGGFATVFFSHD